MAISECQWLGVAMDTASTSLSFEQLADVHVLRHLDPRGRQFPGTTVQNRLVDVAERHHPHAGDLPEHLEVVTALATHADHPHADGIVGAQRGGPRGPREGAGSGHATGNGLREKTASADRVGQAVHRVQRYRHRAAVSRAGPATRDHARKTVGGNTAAPDECAAEVGARSNEDVVYVGQGFSPADALLQRPSVS